MKKITAQYTSIGLSIIVSLFVLSGCATPAQSTNMKADGLVLAKKHSQTVAVQTGGGSPTNPAWISAISNEDLAAAIEESIRTTQVFSRVVSIGGADYTLSASIVNLNQPMVGFNMTVELEVVWALIPKGETKPVWEKSIKSKVTKGVGDAFAGAKRLRITTEAAAKENIADALKQLSALELK